MVQQVITASASDSVLNLAQKMTSHQVSCLVIVREMENPLPLIPIGIITEGDIVQFQALGLNLAHLQAEQVMSTPLFPIHPEDSLWNAHCQMQSLRIRRLVVTTETGALSGIITQSGILQGLDPMELLGNIEELQQMLSTQTTELNQINSQLKVQINQKQQLERALHQANQALEHRIDLTLAELKEAETPDPQTTQQRLQYLLSSSPTVIYCRRPLGDYGMISISQNLRTLLGYEADTFLQDPQFWLTQVHPQDREGACQLHPLNTHARQIRMRHRDGTYRWILDQFNVLTDSLHQPIEVLGYWLDITERIEAELERDRFFNLSVDMLCIAGQDGFFKRINPAFEQVLGYSEAELLGQPFLNFVHPDDQAETLEALGQLTTGKHVAAFENRYRRHDGSYCWLLWSSVPYPEKQLIYAVARDITQRKQVEEELRRQSRYEQLLAEISNKIRRSLQLPTILQTTVQEVLRLLQCDRVLIARIQFDGTVVVIQEARQSEWESMLNAEYSVPAPKKPIDQASKDLITKDFSPLPLLPQFNVKEQLELLIFVRDNPWGFLIVQQCDRSRIWESDEKELLEQLADQLGIALSQSQLLQQLEDLVEQRTLELSNTNRNLQQEIQDRIAIETELRENEQRLAGILATADEAIISIDEQQVIQMFNQGAERTFGYSAQEIIGQPLSLLLPDVYQSKHQRYVHSFSADRNTSQRMVGPPGGVWGRRKNGEVFPAEASISRLSTRDGLLFTAILKDITERRQAEQALRRSQNLLQQIIDNSPSLISVMDLEHRHLLVNRSYAEFLSRTKDELIGWSIYDVWPPEVADVIASNNKKTLNLNTPIQVEEILIRGDGPHTYLSSIFPLQAEDGNPYAICGISTDITSRKLVERLKDEFVSVVSHELRTPLTSIHGSLKLLATGQLGDMTQEGQEVLDIAADNTERLIRLVGDVLDLERIESGRYSLQKSHCEAAFLLSQAADIMRPMTDRHGIRIEIKAPPVMVWADPDPILQTLTNLLSNAIKFSPDHTTVWMEVDKEESHILFTVRDQGRGIPADRLESIFERFQQVDASDSRIRGGTGLGLAICRSIVEQHGGKIWVESTPGQGSSFYFTLPLYASDLEEE
jgi:PAS domain S-box-containing protein